MAPHDPLQPLLAAVLEGDDSAVAELVRRTQGDVWSVCSALGSRGEEEDLVQETYLRALRSLRSFRGDSSVKTWLMAIARNVCADHVRRRERQRRLLQRIRPLPADGVTLPREPIDDILAQISPDRREAFAMTQLLGLSYEEASTLLECPIGTVRSRVARARADLLELVRGAQAI